MPAEGLFWKLLKDLGAEHDRQLSSMVALVRDLRMELNRSVTIDNNIASLRSENLELRKQLANRPSMLSLSNGLGENGNSAVAVENTPNSPTKLKLPLTGLMERSFSSASLPFPMGGGSDVKEPQNPFQTDVNVVEQAADGCAMLKTLEPQSQHQPQLLGHPELQQQQQQQAELSEAHQNTAPPNEDVAEDDLPLPIRTESQAIDESTLSPIQRRLLFMDNPRWDTGICILIMANTIIMMFEAQYDGMKSGYITKFPGMDDKSVDERYPGAETFLIAVDKLFTIIFTIELIMCIVRYRWPYFRILLSWIDVISVVASLLHWIVADVWKASFIRLLRVARLVRGVRFLKGNKIQHSLKILLKSMQASGTTLFWSLGLLMVVQCIVALVIGQVANHFISDVSNPIEERHELFRYYGTFTKAFITMFEVHMANWAGPCRIVINTVGETYGNLFVLYRCIAGFALMSVIGAVFVQQAMSVQQQDQDIMIMRKQKEANNYNIKLKKLFRSLDTDGDGQLSKEEFEAITANSELKAWMESLDINPDDLQGLFSMLDTGDGYVSADEFLTGATRVRGSARNIDVAQLLVMVNRLEPIIHRLDSFAADVVLRLDKLGMLVESVKDPSKRSNWASMLSGT